MPRLTHRCVLHRDKLAHSAPNYIELFCLYLEKEGQFYDIGSGNEALLSNERRSGGHTQDVLEYLQNMPVLQPGETIVSHVWMRVSTAVSLRTCWKMNSRGAFSASADVAIEAI